MQKIFVSSTFRDMHLERDAFKNKLAPMLNKHLSPYGESVDFIDLRWGIDTSKLESEESNKKVLKVCLDEIDEAKPYTIVLIGNRYGWIPPYHLMEETYKNKGIDLNDKNISITNLEIEYSAFLNGKPNRKALFYFRNIKNMELMGPEEKKLYLVESPLHERKLNALKEKIKQTYPNQVRYYDVTYNPITKSLDGLDDFIKNVYQDLAKTLTEDEEQVAYLKKYKATVTHSHRFFEKYYLGAFATHYVNINKEFDDEIVFDYPILPLFELITGKTGSGVKTVLAQKYKKSLDNKDVITIPYVYSLNDETEGLFSFAKFLMDLLEDLLHINEKDKLVSSTYIAELIDEYSSSTKKPIDIYVMNATEAMIGFVKAIEASQSEIPRVAFHFAMNVYHDASLPYFKKNFHLEVDELNKEEKYSIITNILKKKNKELPPLVIHRIISKPGATSPLYISLLIESLLYMDKDDFSSIYSSNVDTLSLESYMIKSIDSRGNTIKELAKDLFVLLMNKIDKEMVARFIAIVSIKEPSFDKEEIEKFFAYKKWRYDELTLSLFQKSIPNLFTNDNEYVEFASDEIREAAKEIVGQRTILDVINWLKNDSSLDEDDSFAYTKYRLPFLYSYVRDSRTFADDYISKAKIMIANVEAPKTLDELYQTNAIIPCYIVLKDDVENNDGKFADDVQKEIFKKIKNKEIDDVDTVAQSLISYIGCNDDYKGKIGKFLKHTFYILDLYLKAYLDDPDDTDFHTFFILLVNQFNSIYHAQMYLDEEQLKMMATVQEIVNKPEEQAYLNSLSQKNMRVASQIGIVSIMAFVELYRNKDAYPPMFIQQIKGYVDKATEASLAEPNIQMVIKDPMVLYKNDVLTFSITGTVLVIAIQFAFQGYREEHVGIYNRYFKPLMNIIIDYFLEDDISWDNITSINSLFCKAIHLFNSYQRDVENEDVDLLDNFDDLYDLNDKILKFLKISSARQQYDTEPVRCILNGVLDEVYFLDDNDNAFVYGIVDNLVNITNEKETLLSCLSLLYFDDKTLELEERDALFNKIITKTFENIYSINTNDTEESLLDLFVSIFSNYLYSTDREEDKEYIMSFINEHSTIFPSYKDEEIYELLTKKVEVD